jgi:hypothetical protein
MPGPIGAAPATVWPLAVFAVDAMMDEAQSTSSSLALAAS